MDMESWGLTKGAFCKGVELARGESVTNGASVSSLHLISMQDVLVGSLIGLGSVWVVYRQVPGKVAMVIMTIL